MLIRKFA